MDKSRGLKHHKNKAKYQNKSKVLSKPVAQTERTHQTSSPEHPVSSNLYRYEELPEVNNIDESTNFSLLVQAPISRGGHFQFQKDKDIQAEVDVECLRNNKLFLLDLEMLEHSINTISFYERCGLNKSYFTNEQIKAEEETCQRNVAQYCSFLETRMNNSQIEEELNNSIETSKANEKTNECEELISQVLEANDVQELIATDLKSSGNGEKENLEQWLDDILDD